MKLLWLQSGGCGGCTMSLLCSSARDLPGLLAGAGIELAWHPSLSEATGDAVRTLLAEFESGRTALDLLCVEGSLLTGPAGSGRFHMLSGTGRAMIDWVRSLAARARYTLAVGTCAAYGGITAAGLNPAGAVGLQYDGEQRGGLLGADYRSAAGLPVINVAGCPTHPDWVTDTLIALALGRFAEADLDALGRPRFYADQLVHHGCTRNEFYEFKASAETPGDLGCMMEHLGCKGTQAHADCNSRPWNGLGSCTNGGYPCISCTEPGFESPGHPFGLTPKVAGIPIGLPSDMPKAWFVALAALSKSATPERVRRNSVVEAPVLAPATRRTRLK
ncbi:MAG TPA: HupU protein [Rhodocyclaceae bacterium]|nr:HupU protein [Rhodocyclaceae bacterium]